MEENVNIGEEADAQEGMKEHEAVMDKTEEEQKEHLNRKDRLMVEVVDTRQPQEQLDCLLADTTDVKDYAAHDSMHEESDTPVEENEEAMLPEDGVLVRYVYKADQKQQDEENKYRNHQEGFSLYR